MLNIIQQMKEEHHKKILIYSENFLDALHDWPDEQYLNDLREEINKSSIALDILNEIESRLLDNTGR